MTSILLSILGNILLFLVGIFGPIFLVFAIMRSHFVLFVIQRKKKRILIPLDDGNDYLVELSRIKPYRGMKAQLFRQRGIRGFRFWLNPPWRCIGYWPEADFMAYIQTNDSDNLEVMIRNHMSIDGNNALRVYNSRKKLTKQTIDFFKQH